MLFCFCVWALYFFTVNIWWLLIFSRSDFIYVLHAILFYSTFDFIAFYMYYKYLPLEMRINNTGSLSPTTERISTSIFHWRRHFYRTKAIFYRVRPHVLWVEEYEPVIDFSKLLVWLLDQWKPISLKRYCFFFQIELRLKKKEMKLKMSKNYL